MLQDGLALVQASAGMGVPVSVSPCVGATCPFIIFESADINSAVDEVIEAAFRKKSEVIQQRMGCSPDSSCSLLQSPLCALPSGALGVVRAGERVRQRCGSSEAALGRVKVRFPSKRG